MKPAFQKELIKETWKHTKEQKLNSGISIGLERGLEQGLERRAYQTKLETARTFLTMGLSPAQGTGLPMETIQELIDS